MKNLFNIILAGAALTCANFALAASSLQLSNQVFQELDVKGTDGKVERKTVPAATVVPGTEVFYVINYKNTGDQPAEKIAITNPMPSELEYVSTIGPSATGEVSVDGGRNYGDLANLTVTGTDGASRAAKSSDVTHVRWKLASSLKPGDEGKVSFRAKLK